ncbi:MAG: glycosyltransferase family 39 protein, partial [Bacteroidota bacterium]
MSNTFKYLVVFGLFAGLLILSAIYSDVWYDDAGHFLVVQQLAETGSACYPVDLAGGFCDPASAYITMGPALNYPLAGWMQMFGMGMGTARILMLLLSVLTLGAFIWMGRQVVQERKVFWAALLVVGNIQFMTYGAQVLGEVPMLGWLFLGLGLCLRGLEKERSGMIVLAGLSWGLAILTKEYIAVPLAVSMFIWMAILGMKGKWKPVFALFGAGLAVILLVVGWYLIRTGGLKGLVEYMAVRQSYGSEFFALNFSESMRFLLWKPLIALGSVALLVKLYFQRKPVE